MNVSASLSWVIGEELTELIIANRLLRIEIKMVTRRVLLSLYGEDIVLGHYAKWLTLGSSQTHALWKMSLAISYLLRRMVTPTTHA